MNTTALKFKAILIETVAGVVGGLLIGLPCALIGRMLGGLLNNGWSDLVGALLGAALGYVLGVAAGVSLADRYLKQAGSFWFALLGSVIGGGLVLLLAQPLRLNEMPGVLQGLFILLPPIAAVAAVRSRARRRERA
jgi:uncharacterized membrane protein